MIGGNIKAVLQTKTIEKTDIGEAVSHWSDSVSLLGWLDLSNGDSKHTAFYAKIQESTHIFICDYKDLSPYGITAENCRMLINGLVYEILLIDNPMELNRQLEIYLKFVGGQNGE